ncbi:Mitochondrial fission 1 protein [Toxocara canis]|uniref:Mitochondrial fission 1 protein n=1 Tax=Toxocara canis TaxID=6265 RepID=A0A0B2V1J6_TOXCA|nr:Mitochondrial fission 1 protein [Toxocara canis]
MDVGTIVDETIEPAELMRFAKVYLDQTARGSPSAVAVFSYAHALIKSNKEDVKKGIKLLEDLLRRDAEDVSKRDYIYYLAIAHTRLKEYDRALAYIDILLSAESHNRQAIELKDLIKKRMRNDGILGMAILGGGLAVVGGLVVAAIAAAKSK